MILLEFKTPRTSISVAIILKARKRYCDTVDLCSFSHFTLLSMAKHFTLEEPPYGKMSKKLSAVIALEKPPAKATESFKGPGGKSKIFRGPLGLGTVGPLVNASLFTNIATHYHFNL